MNMSDTNIPMSGAILDTATPIYKAQQQQNQNDDQANQNAMAAEQTLKAHYEALDAREKSRLSSTIVGAAQLKQFLDTNDIQGAQNFLMQRRAQLHQRIAGGENIDTQETDYALQALQAGPQGIQELKNSVDGLMAAGQVYGILQRNSNPYTDQFAAVQKAHPEWTAAQVQDYVYGRGNPSKGTTFDPGTGRIVNQAGAVEANAEKAGAESFAKGAGGKAGEQVIKNNDTLGSLGTLQQAVESAQQQLPKVAATGPVFGRVGDAARDVEYVNLQRDLNEITLLAKDLYNLGSGQGFTDADRDFLKELSGGLYNRAESIQYALERFNRAIEHRANFLQGQNTAYQAQYGAGANPPQQPNTVTPTGQKIRVSNGKETFAIDPNDLQAAQKDGYQQVQ